MNIKIILPYGVILQLVIRTYVLFTILYDYFGNKIHNIWQDLRKNLI